MLDMSQCQYSFMYGKLYFSFVYRTRQADFICVKLSNNGDFLAAATTDNIITLWRLHSAEVVLSLPGHTE